MSTALSVVTSVLVGLGSSLFPLLNAEAYLVIALTSGGWAAIALVLFLAAGQTAGKVLILEASRRGSSRLANRPRAKAGEQSETSAKIKRALSERRTAAPMVFVSAAVGLPPLALVSVVAGVADQKRSTFAVACLVGRIIRFTVIGIPVMAALSRS